MAAGTTVDFEALALLLKAPSKNHVDRMCTEVFKNRRGPVSEELASGLEGLLGADRNAVNGLIRALRALIGIAIYENSAELDALFPASFHGDMKSLLLQIIDAHLSDWRVGVQEAQVSLPKFQNVDWRIDVKRASENVAAMSVPSVLVTVDIADANVDGGTRSVTFELTKQSLSTMVDGMEKIKEQLGSLKHG